RRPTREPLPRDGDPRHLPGRPGQARHRARDDAAGAVPGQDLNPRSRYGRTHRLSPVRRVTGARAASLVPVSAPAGGGLERTTRGSPERRGVRMVSYAVGRRSGRVPGRQGTAGPVTREKAGSGDARSRPTDDLRRSRIGPAAAAAPQTRDTTPQSSSPAPCSGRSRPLLRSYGSRASPVGSGPSSRSVRNWGRMTPSPSRQSSLAISLL